MLILLSGFIGAILGASASILFNIWKFHRDERSARLDEFCKLAAEVASLASDYWSQSFSDTDKQLIAEAKIRGAQALLDGLYEDFRLVADKRDAAILDERMSVLSDNLSGGTFSERGRTKDILRVSSTLSEASGLIVEIRRCHRRTMPLQGLFRSYHDNRWRELDMPPPTDREDCLLK